MPSNDINILSSKDPERYCPYPDPKGPTFEASFFLIPSIEVLEGFIGVSRCTGKPEFTVCPPDAIPTIIVNPSGKDR